MFQRTLMKFDPRHFGLQRVSRDAYRMGANASFEGFAREVYSNEGQKRLPLAFRPAVA